MAFWGGILDICMRGTFERGTKAKIRARRQFGLNDRHINPGLNVSMFMKDKLETDLRLINLELEVTCNNR